MYYIFVFRYIFILFVLNVSKIVNYSQWLSFMLSFLTHIYIIVRGRLVQYFGGVPLPRSD
jgi:hypothetical protein